jgi:pimeloyl-ACP methyl ester carboxylesterase
MGRVELSTETWGGGDRRIMLVHGLSSSAGGWWRLGPDLAAAGCTVVAPNLRGHGGSGDGDGFSLDAYRDDVLGLGGGYDMVLGHSLGGLIVLACQLADPGFARSLVLEDPFLRPQPTPHMVAWLLADYEEPITETRLAAARPRWGPRDVAAKVQALRAAGPQVVEGTLEGIGGLDLWPRVADLTVPTLLMGADPGEDALVTRHDAEAAAENPVVRVAVVPGSSHSIHRDSYPGFWSALAAFMAEIGLPVAGIAED